MKQFKIKKDAILIHHNHNPLENPNESRPTHSHYGFAHQKVGESLEDVNAWLEKSADQLQATYETQTIGQNMALEKT